MKKENRTHRNSWYSKKYGHKEQIGLYKLFVERKGIAVELVINLLDEFAVIHLNQKAAHIEKGEVLRRIVNDYFSKFVQEMSVRTGVAFAKNKKPKRQRDSYHDWFQGGQLNGSFAYNGAADDF